MRGLRALWLRLRGMFSGERTREEFAAELESHLAMHMEDNLHAGMTPEQARRDALIKLGGVEQAKQAYHERSTLPLLEAFLQDVRYGLRRLLKSPGFTLTAVLTLALGMGATVAIFSVVNGVVLKPLPYPNPERLVEVRLKLPDVRANNWGLSRADYFIYREQSHAFEDIALYDLGTNASGYSVNVTGVGQAEHVPALNVTDGLLPILGVAPLFGRTFTRADDQPDSPDTVLLTYGYWRRKFGSERSVIGKTIDVDGEPRTIIGVLPRGFSFLDKPDNLAMLLPMKLDRAKIRLGDYNNGAIARLKPGVTLASASADVTRMIPIVFRSFPPYPGGTVKEFENLRLGPNLQSLKQEVVGNVDSVLWVLMGGIGLVLLIACANVANLLLVRAEGRQQELAVRAALGASRSRIAAGLFAESLILAVLGGLFGLALAYGALRALFAMAPTGLPRLNEISIDGRIVLFTFAVSIIASLLFGSVPVFKYASGRSMSEGRERQRSRGLLVIVQISLALVLLVSSGLMIRTFHALSRVDPGFTAPSDVQTFRVYIPETQVKDPMSVLRMQEDILHKLADLPGVSSAGVSESLPMDGGGYLDGMFVKDRVYASNETPLCWQEYVTPGFFKTLGTPLMAGREFTWSEIYNRVPVVMVSEKFARKYWHNPSSALGKQVGGDPRNPKSTWREVVGVVGDVHQDGVDKEAPDAVYWPILTNYGAVDFVGRDTAFVIRSSRAGSESLINEAQQAVRSVEPSLPLAEIRTLDYYYMKSMARTSFTLVMLSLAGGMALLLGVIGLYGVMAYSVSQRTQELGIRIALGAQKRNVLRLVLVRAMSLTMVGVGIGIASALALTRFLSALLYGVKPSDPSTLVTVSLFLVAVAILASYIPARRAASVDPMQALRTE